MSDTKSTAPYSRSRRNAADKRADAMHGIKRHVGYKEPMQKKERINATKITRNVGSTPKLKMSKHLGDY